MESKIVHIVTENRLFFLFFPKKVINKTNRAPLGLRANYTFLIQACTEEGKSQIVGKKGQERNVNLLYVGWHAWMLRTTLKAL